MNSLEAGQVTAQILSIGAVIDAAETLARRADYGPGGIYDWALVRTGRRWSTRGHVAQLLDLLFRPRAFEALMVWQIILSAGLIGSSWPSAPSRSLTAALLAGLFSIRVLNHIRHSYGLDGSDQMSIILLASSTVVFASPTQLGSTAAIYFIAFQSFLAYVSSGAAKMSAPIWRSGRALPAILNTHSYGSWYASRTFRATPKGALLACWTVMLFQLTFPIWALASIPTCTAILILGVLFHLNIAFTMGLNNFVWSFTACYPSVWKIATDLHLSALN